MGYQWLVAELQWTEEAQRGLVTGPSHRENQPTSVVLSTYRPVVFKLCSKGFMKRIEIYSWRKKCPEPSNLFNQSCSMFNGFTNQTSP